ncbi:mandelate racemase/muconate lactonizing enzyme family protein [Agrococcus carbonis]|uniref:L-alanine-DL-glutamate epimerase n=1 Tax=Agrococcus carbonis TaxID=684552 RepID=A0A1H1PRR9_9MICO|nr:enolase C-terminal domain-like protein [Agrococcus carbonis]SDS13786.1 L-alanine-DL-glutamate epimerase [Agrococcus carbonis]
MRIESIETIPYAIDYARPLRFASGEVLVADHVLVRVTTSDGVVGIADAPPRPYTYGETQASIVATIRDRFAPAIVGLDVSDRDRIRSIMRRTVHNDVAKGAIDIAVWDAYAKTLGVGVSSLLGGWSDRVPVAHMLGFCTPDEGVAEAEELRERHGIAAFKVKVGRQPIEQDLALVEALRERLPADTVLYVDANRGWSANQAIAALPRLEGAGVISFEEPCDAAEAMGRRRLAQHSRIPIVGDESVPTPGDAARELQSGGCHSVSIKTARGGFTNATQVLGLADGLGVDVFMGNQIDTQLGTAATLAFAASHEATAARPAELSNYLDMADDLIAEPLEIVEGRMRVPSGPGVGVVIDEEKLDRYRVDR